MRARLMGAGLMGAGLIRAGRIGAGLAGAGDDAGRGDVLRLIVEFESGHGELIVIGLVIGPGLRRRGRRLAHRRGVPETPRLAGSALGPGIPALRLVRAVPRVLVPAGLRGLGGLSRLGPLGSPAWPGAPALELESWSGPAPGIAASWIWGGRNTRDGASTGTRRPGARGTRGAPGAVSLGIAGRFPCHLFLAVFRMPREKYRKRGR